MELGTRVRFDEALVLIETKPRIALLLEQPDDPTCLRARQALLPILAKLIRLDYELYIVEIDELSSKHAALAAVYIPQIRLFKDGVQTHSLPGIPKPEAVQELFYSLES